MAQTSGSLSIRGEVWVDNWFSLYLNGKPLLEDSVPITTERSFNAETFSFKSDYPFVLALVLKDYKANDTGLEYIGQPNQQMGDGGAIAQFTDMTTGQKVAVSNANWKCLVIHQAPLDKSCEKVSQPVAGKAPCTFNSQAEPSGWADPDFDDSQWEAAHIYSKAQVGPKDGYDQISWDSRAQFIWGSDLETDNTVLCRLRVEKPL
ncbi:PEBP family protein [bacterium (Candidatus Blackallbacteria) CG17_big_fil_post_rev_8_21_14_2_50_48_46]|uniref:PEBP family protein n=1 Tax=bacterium (Candidatus Blackallbacteria) CG17_big_fil_post_rev_8_21_14_2_50_48_46 TaxID=2014261 RepID=A0A2M7FZ51_9BACT|nr:MAG: PEBP family protein [bacterium (Candidatus Blackallbacteria) CG18_big_fil_WC_8_21_14_2_50_49_26]PIW14653.1 MAG: PEBP family protein [bacterium (Candidatus Blackallbacteria) CG17_big_fil_post_rev_8_21_14_2_50_48_46]PIW47275.1 MAG: PEBP family protein [bacterium (Candidatus Blackallbacteria) CG13_big_fil_rev_8_21_14_2_50_49_14]